MKNAPLKMLRAGLGDMVAKYISICEWRISSLITGEYYCEEVAELVRDALNKCVANASELVKGNEKAVQNVFEGLVQCGLAMTYAGLSRPASGVEHYFSHIWDMRGLEFGTNCDLHGLQCGVATRISLKLYEKFKTITPDKEKALNYFERFNYGEYFVKLTEFIGKAAELMKENESKEKKYDIKKHSERLGVILKNYDGILKIINEELPDLQHLDKIFDLSGLPKTPAEIGIDENIIPDTFEVTKDIRDKYVLSRLCADLGMIEDMKKYIKGERF